MDSEMARASTRYSALTTACRSCLIGTGPAYAQGSGAAGSEAYCEEAVLKDADLFRADEAFFTSTTKAIVPVVQVDERKIGDGRVAARHQEVVGGVSPRSGTVK